MASGSTGPKTMTERTHHDHPDPVYWKQECRITIQQIAWKGGLAETEDDWSTAT
jgi:hypothetical protein